jgi:hypothetical protein
VTEIEEPIRAKVARILTITDLVLNKGKDDGVYPGMEFVILNRNASNIRDPDTKEIIGSVPVAKTIVKVVNAQPGLAIARTFRNRGQRNDAFGLAALLSSYRGETLKTDEETAVQELDEKDSYVKTGDDAVQVTDQEEYLIPPF